VHSTSSPVDCKVSLYGFLLKAIQRFGGSYGLTPGLALCVILRLNTADAGFPRYPRAQNAERTGLGELGDQLKFVQLVLINK